MSKKSRYPLRPKRRHTTYIYPVGVPSNYRFVGICDCGWQTVPMLTRMQVATACHDHDGSTA